MTSNELLQAERYLCGAMMIDAGRCVEVPRIVSGSDFQDPDVGRFFDLLVTLSAMGEPVSDLGWLIPAIQATNQYKALGRAQVASIITEVPTVAHAIHYAELVKKASQRRRLIAIGQRLAQLDDNADPSDVAATTAADLVALAESQSSREVFTATECVDAVLRKLDAVSNGQPSGIETGIRCIDAIAGTMQPGELVVLAARTSIGKTAFAYDVTAYNASIGKRVLYFSFEMDDYAIGTRMVSRETGIDCETIQSGRLDKWQRQLVEAVKKEVDKWKLKLVTPSKPKVTTIASHCRAHSAKHGLDLVVVDYAGLIHGSKAMSAYERATEIVKDLKLLATSLRIPVLALYQPNREAEGEMPSLADLRDSGAIEDTADKIWFIHRDRRDTATQFKIAKYRNGAVGNVADGLLVFDPSRTSYRDANFSYQEDFSS
jgi:replicative DNA helicase